MDLDDIYKTAFGDKRFFIAADEEFVEMDFIIKNSKEIAIFPPVTGG
jgi:molybdopterin converting factor small subunit